MGKVVICRLFTVASGLAQPIGYVGSYGMVWNLGVWALGRKARWKGEVRMQRGEEN